MAIKIALAGNPNCGKTTLFNHLTGTRQKVANYAGVTVKRKVGHFTLPSGKAVRVLDVPGTYSLDATSPDEEITRDVVQGKIAEEGEIEDVKAGTNVMNFSLASAKSAFVIITFVFDDKFYVSQKVIKQ